jgi:DNA-binding transcriptional MocR family regulator
MRIPLDRQSDVPLYRQIETFLREGILSGSLAPDTRLPAIRRLARDLGINRHLPAGVHVDPPQGGLFAWLRLPDHLSSEKLLPLACEEGVTFAPGSSFFPDGSDGECYMRLNFAAQLPDGIEEGIKRLGKAMRRLA